MFSPPFAFTLGVEAVPRHMLWETSASHPTPPNQQLLFGSLGARKEALETKGLVCRGLASTSLSLSALIYKMGLLGG